MNPIDFTLLRWITAYANVWPSFDGLLAFLVHWEVAKGGVVVALYWFVWFRKGKTQQRQRTDILVALFAALLSLLLASVAALALPYRPRPRILVGMDPALSPGWAEWSAFPSDHATLFFALAVGVWRVVPKLGLFTLVHALLIVSFPRVYLGLHYPTDIAGGAFLGVATALIMPRIRWVRTRAAQLVNLAERHPTWFYALAFVASYSVATLFGDWRRAANTFFLWLRRG